MVEKKPEVETDEVVKKHTKVANNSADSASPRSRLKEGPGSERGKQQILFIFISKAEMII